MKQYREELTPVRYGPTLIKIHHHSARPNQPCLAIHWHDRMELIILRQGEITVGYDANTAPLRPGEIYIIPPKTPHYAINGGSDAAWDVLMFDVRSFYNDTELCRNYLEPLFDGRAKFRMTTNHPEITACCDQILELAPQNDFGVISLIYRLFALLFAHALVEISGDIKGRHLISEATAFIKDNYAQELTTKTLALQFGYSQEHFCRLFKETTQFSPMQYLKICRLERAANLLSEGKCSVSEVSSRCGFSDPNYFTRCFKTFFGITPTQMWKSHEN